MALETSKTEVVRRYVKYVFLDVVKFSSRSAEAQSEIVHQLNQIVFAAMHSRTIMNDARILIPTGDGMCIALTNLSQPYDTHIQLALAILALLKGYNMAVVDGRKFEVRIGINQNTDISVRDINGRENVAGAGVNIASRIMDKADGGQILVSRTVYDELEPSEKYRGRFKHFHAVGKHGLKFDVSQFVDANRTGLNCAMPSDFFTAPVIEAKLNLIAAYYLAHAIRNKAYLLQTRDLGRRGYTLTVILWLLAKDSEGTAKSTEILPHRSIIHGEGSLTLAEIFETYNKTEFQVLVMAADFIHGQLRDYWGCFAEGQVGRELLFVNDNGRQKLKEECPAIWKEFEPDGESAPGAGETTREHSLPTDT